MPSSPSHEYVAFVHMQARDATARKFAATTRALADAHSVCARYFERQYELMCRHNGTANAVLVRQCLTRLPVHIIGANDVAGAQRLLCSPEYCEMKCAVGMVAELALDFSAAEAHFGREDGDDADACDSASIFADFAECLTRLLCRFGGAVSIEGRYGMQGGPEPSLQTFGTPQSLYRFRPYRRNHNHVMLQTAESPSSSRRAPSSATSQ